MYDISILLSLNKLLSIIRWFIYLVKINKLFIYKYNYNKEYLMKTKYDYKSHKFKLIKNELMIIIEILNFNLIIKLMMLKPFYHKFFQLN